MTDIINKIKDNKKVFIIVYALIMISALVIGNQTVSFALTAASVLLSLYCVIRHKERPDTAYFAIVNIAAFICIVAFFLLSSAQGLIVFEMTLAAFCFFFTLFWKKQISLFSASVIIPGLLEIALIDNTNCGYIYAILLICCYMVTLLFLSSFVGEKVAISISVVGYGILYLICGCFRQYRFACLTVNELLSASTFLEVAGNYHFDISQYFFKIILPCLLILVPFLILKKTPKYKFRIRYRIVLLILIVPLNLALSFHVKDVLSKQEQVLFSMTDIFRRSFADEIELKYYKVYKDDEEEKVATFKSDPEEAFHPNIVTVMCESYADIEKAYNFVLSDDPLREYRELSGSNIRKGKVKCSTYGGGTSRSEFEYLTAIPSDCLTQYRNPYMTDITCDVSFTADPLYDSYTKSLIHPFRRIGWNRPHVYETFNYDSTTFLEDWGEIEEKYRKYVSDKSFYNKVLDEIENTDDPLWVMGITMQNHGGYDDENNITVNILNQDENTEYLHNYENYLSCVKKSSSDLADFVAKLDELKDEPTIFIFFGDHFPSNLPKQGVNEEECYETPYLVYSNYCDLDEMPEELNLTHLLPYAKKAAGLPMSGWEKYLISLNGHNIDRDMAITRLRYGYF